MEKLFIKNMVCDRCKLVVKQELKKIGVSADHVELGEVTVPEPLTTDQHAKLKSLLEDVGFELIEDAKTKWINRIKRTIVEMIHSKERKNIKINYSDYIAQEVGRDYAYLSGLFSELEGITIEHYIIHQKIARVKELLMYNELTLSQIAIEMGYSSVAHLSAQFKKVTGITPSQFKSIDKRREPLDHL
jgi:YesN/AraC family two-component response regulator